MVKIWKDKDGKWITPQEFLERFKQGANNITPMQKLSNEARGTMTTIIGFIVSIIAVIWNRETIGLLSYGLIIIFIGNLVTSFLKWVSIKQQLKFIKALDSNATGEAQ